MRIIITSVVLAVAAALINLSWAGQDQKQDKKEKAQDVGKGLELKGNLDNSLGMTYTLPDPKNGESEKMSHQLYLVNLIKDKSYQIEMIPGPDAQMIPYLVIEDAKKKVLDERSGGKNARMLYKAPENGIYRIIATTNGGVGEGDFILKVTEGKERDKTAQEKQKPQDVGKGFEINSSLDNLRDNPYDAQDADAGNKRKTAHKLFLVNCEKGKTYQIDMITADADGVRDPYLFLEDAKKKVLAQDDDGGGDLNSQILFTAPESGVYRIICTSFGGSDEGGFTLKVVEKK